MYGFIGIGQAGNSIINECYKYDYPTIGINFSQKDLDSCNNIENKIRLVGSEGVGRDRSRAMELMQDNWEIVTEYVKQKFSHPSIEVIFVVFSTAGGTGSGISPVVIEMLNNEMSEKVFVACPVIPDTTEPIANQMNCLETFQELSELDNAIFPIDNEKMRQKQSSKNRLYSSINGCFLHQVDRLLHYTEQYSPYSNLDKRDLLTIFKTKGIGLISELEIVNAEGEVQPINSEYLTKAISSSWSKGIFADNSMKKVNKAGIIIDGHDSVMESLNMQQLFNSIEKGMPLSIFEGYYSTGENRIFTVLTGLPWCNERLKQIDQLIEERKANFTEDNEEDDIYQPKNTNMNISFNTPKQDSKPKSKKSSLEILKKFSRK